MCISKLRFNEFYSTESWRIGIWTLRRDTPEILRMHLVQTEFGKGKGNLEALSKKVNLMSEILARPIRRNIHLRKPEVAWNLARKYASSNRRQLRFILLWKRERHRRSYVYCVFGSFNAQCWARTFELRFSGYFEKVLAQDADIHMSGKRRTSTIDQKWEDNYLYRRQLSTSRCIKTVIIFQQHFVYNIEINGSVQLFQKIGTIIRSSNSSKWQACMRGTVADNSWQAGHGELWTSKRDEQGRSNARHSF